MQVGIVNLSKDPQITIAFSEEVANALEEQLYQDYAPFHQSAGFPVSVYSSLSQLPPGTSPLAILDSPEDAGELGDHYVTNDGLPIGRAFWAPTRDNGGTLFDSPTSLSVTLSHEILEMIGDPYINAWYDMPDGETEDAAELCDRVESLAYQRSGSKIFLSNFLGPRAFRSGPGPYDWMRQLTDPWDYSQGYAIRRTGGPKGETRAIFGKAFPHWKKSLKHLKHTKATRRGCVAP